MCSERIGQLALDGRAEELGRQGRVPEIDVDAAKRLAMQEHDHVSRVEAVGTERRQRLLGELELDDSRSAQTRDGRRRTWAIARRNHDCCWPCRFALARSSSSLASPARGKQSSEDTNGKEDVNVEVVRTGELEPHEVPRWL